MNATNRRTFLATSAATAAAALAPAGVHAAANEVIKVGVIGSGGRGTGAAIDCLTADKAVKIVALGDAFQHRVDGAAGRLQKQFGDRAEVPADRRFAGLDAYKKVLETDADLIILATPPGFRPLHVEAAVKTGKHIFCEKPVAVDGPGIRRVLAAAEESKGKKMSIVAGTQRRHQNGYLETMKRILGGEIGAITAATAYWNNNGIWFRDRKELQDRKKFPENPSDLAYQLHNWYHFMWLCGDHIVEQHIHNLDVVNWAKQAHPVRCWGMGGRLNLGGPSNRRAGEAEVVGNIFDHFAVEYEYADGCKLHSYCRHFDGPGDVSEGLVGTKGVCRTEDRKEYSINGKNILDPATDKAGYVQEHVDLIASIRSGKYVNELQQVAESTLTAIMGRMATYTGRAITWEQALNSKEDTFPGQMTWDMQLSTAPVSIPGKTKFI
jgi:predicted dehydrogenase